MNTWSNAILWRDRLFSFANFHKIFTEQVRYSRRANLRKPRTHHRREIVKILSRPEYKKWYDGLSIQQTCFNAVLSRQRALEGKVRNLFV